MDITRILEADHRETEHVLGKITRAKGGARRPLVASLNESLRKHMELEEKVVYPTVDRVVDHDEFVEGNTEHDLMRRALDDMMRLAPDQPGFGAALAIVRAAVAHHVGDEEDDVFPVLRRHEPSLQELAKPFLDLRQSIGMPMPPAAFAAASSKGELAREAHAAGIERSSSMTKDELARSLVTVMSS